VISDLKYDQLRCEEEMCGAWSHYENEGVRVAEKRLSPVFHHRVFALATAHCITVTATIAADAEDLELSV
jgi:hypothetical protein